MSRKKVFFISYFVFAMSLFANSVSAQGGLEGAFETIRKLFGFLPQLISLERLVGGDTAALFWAKFIIWVLVFAIIYFGTTAIPKLSENKRISTVIALAISLISTLLIPDAIIINIIQTYSLVAAILLWFIPLAAALYLNHVVQHRGLKALVLFLALIVLWNIHSLFDSNAFKIMTSKVAVVESISGYFDLLLAIVSIMFLWNLFAAIFGEGGAAEGARGWAGEHIRNGWNNLNEWNNRRRHRGGGNEEDLRRAEELNKKMGELERQLREELERKDFDEMQRLRVLAELIRELGQIQEELRNLGGFR